MHRVCPCIVAAFSVHQKFDICCKSSQKVQFKAAGYAWLCRADDQTDVRVCHLQYVSACYIYSRAVSNPA